MALKATVYKAELQVSDMDRHYYQSHALTLALHPSETEERMMIRLLAFALHASEDLVFGRGLSTEEDAALWRKDLTDHIQLWIDVGLPDEKRIKKASHRADRVQIYSYGERTAPIWWEQNRKKIRTFSNVQVHYVTPTTCSELVTLCDRTMHLHCTVQDGDITLGNDRSSVTVQLEPW
ncbi:MAG: YaeQ family protein [Pseudomonadota bacterium]|nr:YaeQ family protein [Pseudomonadota bacterium]